MMVLQEFLDGATEGAIYFSLGTNVRSDAMTREKIQIFNDVFSQLSEFRVLWKYEDDNLPEMPSNVMICKWFPQQDILGGLQSTEETIRTQVPVLGFPFFGDQDLNMQMKYSEISQDHPQTSKERAVWWTEYVIRHKGARHLRSGIIDISWFEYFMLDVLTFILISSILIFWAINRVVQLLVNGGHNYYIYDTVHSALILGVFPIPSISHQVVYHGLLRELNSRGHEIVIITPNPLNNSSLKNYREIDVSNLYIGWRERFNFLKSREMGATRKDFAGEMMDTGKDLCTGIFENSEFKTFMETNKGLVFDLVIMEWLVTPCTCGLAYHFAAPIVGISSLGILYPGYESIGNPVHPIYYSDSLYPALKNPSIWEKFHRMFYYLWFKWQWTAVLQEQDKIARRFINSSLPYLGDLERNVSLVFTNVATSNHFVVPKVPTLIELGQMHFQEIKPLPKDLQEYLDAATKGAIYFSLGTNVRTECMSQEHLQIFNDVFSQLSHIRVLWKYDGDYLPGKPSNVKISKWFPQQDIFAHPNLKAIVFQGGLQSAEEAIRAQVPVLGFPILADQDLNMQMIVDNGIGEMLYFEELTREKLLSTLKKIIYDPKYKLNMQKFSKITQDHPQTSKERAVWWTEYVIRHKGASHLRAGTMDVSWFEYFMLDAVAVIFISIILILWGIYRVITIIMRILNSSKKMSVKGD
ncbi:hypothetical protein C0J52_00971 [Blattella germanica]|nr:hypothetical protein C0J52_00971 [Blattella germanica]